MKRLTKLTLLCIFLLLLVIGYLVIIHISNRRAREEKPLDVGEQINTSYTAAQLDIATMYAIRYTLDGTEYAFSLSDDRTAWLWNDNKDMPLDSAYFANMASALELITSNTKLNTDPSQLSAYGLDSPWLTITVSDEAHGVQTFTLGDYNGFNEKYYFKSSADPANVYMVDRETASPFAYTPYQMVKNDTLPAIDPIDIKTITLKAADTVTVYSFDPLGVDGDPETTNKWYVSTKGQEPSAVSSELAQHLCDLLETVKLDKPVGFSLEDKKQMGLDTPTEMTVTYSERKTVTDGSTGASTTVVIDNELTLLLGYATENGNIYVGVKDSVLTYLVDGTSLSKVYSAVIRTS